MKAFDFLENKTQTLGKTMVLDKGLGLNEVDDLIATAGDYMTFAKFGWGTAATMDSDLIDHSPQRTWSIKFGRDA